MSIAILERFYGTKILIGTNCGGFFHLSRWKTRPAPRRGGMANYNKKEKASNGVYDLLLLIYDWTK
jgi:hypothetical protein